MVGGLHQTFSYVQVEKCTYVIKSTEREGSSTGAVEKDLQTIFAFFASDGAVN